MPEFLQQLYDLSHYHTKSRQQNALFVYIALTVLLVLVTFYMLFVPDAGTTNTVTRLQSALSGNILSIMIVVTFYIGIPFAYVATRRGQLYVGGIALSLMWYILAIFPVFFGSRNMIHPTNAMSLAILIIISGLILHERGLIGGTAVALITLLTNFSPELINTLPITVSQLVGISIFVFMYIRYAQISRDEGAEQEGEERLKLAEITTQIASLTLNRTELNNVLRQGLDTIQNGYPQFYHAQVFLIDETGRKAQLVSSTGEAGRALLQRQHSIGVGTQSVIGQSTLRNTHIISSSADTSSVHQRNEFLPDTLLEASFPLRVGEQVIGALDLQSKLDLKLSDNDISTYQSLANSFALAIDNVRQFEAAETRIQENQKLAQQARQALQEVDRLNKRLMEQAWSEYLASQEGNVGFNVDFETNQVESSEAWSDTLSQALEDGSLIQSVADDRRLIAIPLKVRGQVVGAMEFEMDADGNIDPNDLNLIQEVSERFGLAVENTRLVEESQRVAQREALINEIGSRLQATNNVESTLTEAVRSLSNILGAKRVSIKLDKQET